MPQSIHVASKLWVVADSQNLDLTPPNNSNGFDCRFSYVAGTIPAANGSVAALTVLFSSDGVTFNPWISRIEFPGTDFARDGVTPRTSFGVSGKWPIEDDGTGTKTNRILRASTIRFILEVLQPFTAALDVVPT